MNKLNNPMYTLLLTLSCVALCLGVAACDEGQDCAAASRTVTSGIIRGEQPIDVEQVLTRTVFKGDDLYHRCELMPTADPNEWSFQCWDSGAEDGVLLIYAGGERHVERYSAKSTENGCHLQGPLDMVIKID